MDDESISTHDPLLREPDQKVKLAICGIALIVALVSLFVLAPRFSSPDAYKRTVESLDAKKETVMGLVAASTASSAAVSLLPGDVGTPIADKLIDLSSDFMIVLAAIYLEKYLLTIMGFAAFKVLVPVGCLLAAIGAYFRYRSEMGAAALAIGAKFIVFGISIVLVVPVSVMISNMVEATYESSVHETIAATEETNKAIEDAAQEEAAAAATGNGQVNIFETISQLPNAIQSLPETVTGLTKEVQDSVNGLIESLAVMIVTSCVIPILVLLFFLWLMQVILGIKVDIPMRGFKPGPRRRVA